MSHQKEFDSLKVRPIKPEEEEEEKWNWLMNEYHYLGFRKLVGESIKYIVEISEKWNALIGWSTAAFKCKIRDEWIGWTKEQQWRRLVYIANNSRFLILPCVQIPNLASKALSMNLKRISADWIAIYGHPILIAETFVEHSRFAGTCYRAANWIMLGQTQGFGRNAGKYYHHGKTKTIYVYPLHRKAKQMLTACFLNPELTKEGAPMIDLNHVNLGSEGGLLWYFMQLKDPRKPRGIRHAVASILTIAACAVLSGCRSYSAIGEWAKDLPQDLLHRLGCRLHPEKGIYVPPSEPTIRRQLQKMDADEFDQAINEWLAKQADAEAIAVDGKTLKGAKNEQGNQIHLMAAILHKEGVVISQTSVDGKTNEITRFRPLLDNVAIKNKVITADAMHTQVDHAKYLKEEREADFVLEVKGNQALLLEAIKVLGEDDFSPCVCREG